MAHDTDRSCACRAVHAPAPLELERHHVWPLGMGGPDADSNIVWVCPTTHTNIHEILRLIVKRQGNLTWGDVLALYDQPVSRYAFTVAHDGYRAWKAPPLWP